MSGNLDLAEQDAVTEFLQGHTALKRGLIAFNEAQVQRYRADCAGWMSGVPRDVERASDAAAKAEAYATWLEELRYFVKDKRT